MHYSTLFLILVLFSFPLLHTPSFQGLALAHEDYDTGEDSDVDAETFIDNEGAVPEERAGVTHSDQEYEDEFEGVEEENVLKKAPGVETYMLLTSHPDLEMTVGDKAVALVGFFNGAEEDYFIHSIHGSLRHPQDISYIIENFTVLALEESVPANARTAFDYSFALGELYLPRSYGLVIEIFYKKTQGETEQEYGHAVYNGTINLLEAQEMFDTETFFMYVFMVTGIIIFVFILHYVWTLTSGGRKHQNKSAKKTQTSAEIVGQEEAEKRTDVDFSWVSPAAAQSMSKSPRSPKNKRNPK